MADEQKRQKQVEALMAQDPQLDDSKLKDFRMQLEQNLTDWERRGARMQRIAVIAIVTYFVFGAVMMFVRTPVQSGHNDGSLIRNLFAMITWTALIVSGYAIAAYFIKFAPAIRRLRYDIQNSMLAELQQQVAALREEVRNRP